MWVQSIPVSRRALLAIARNSDSDPSVRGEENTKKQGVSQGGKSSARLGSNLGPDSAEYPLKPHYKTQNQAKRFNKLDNQNCFGPREVALFPQWFLWFAGILGSNWVQVSRGFFVHYSTLLVRRLP